MDRKMTLLGSVLLIFMVLTAYTASSVATTITRPPVLLNYLLYKEQQRLPPWRTSRLIRKTDDHGKYNDHLEEHGSGG